MSFRSSFGYESLMVCHFQLSVFILPVTVSDIESNMEMVESQTRRSRESKVWPTWQRCYLHRT